MPSPNQLHAQGTVIEILRDHACRVELPNGHRCVAHLEKKAVIAPPAIGHTVRLAFHPYDLSRARIIE